MSRILTVSNLYPPHYLGGYELLCRQVMRELAARGHEITVLTSTHGSGETFETLDGMAVRRVLRLDTPFGAPPSVSRWRRLRAGRHNRGAFVAVATAFRPDVVFVWSQLRLTIACTRAAQCRGLPTVCTMNDPHLGSFVAAPFRPTPKGLVRWLTDRTLCRSTTLLGLRLDRVTCISKTLRADLLALHVPVADSRIIYQGIPLEQFPLKEHPGSLGSPPRLLYVGQLHPYKGVHTLLAAAAVLRRDRGLPLRLSIAGDGPAEYREQLQRQAESEGLDVAFLGRLPHDALPALYRENDIFVFTSAWREPFGLTHLEAMASGTPVVSTCDGGHGEFLRHQENALTFEKENAGELADRVLTLVQDGDLRGRLARVGRREVEEHFTLRRYVDDLEQFLGLGSGCALPRPTTHRE
jgi:glycosyltransferase involved in cell wall biosynthesis